MRSVLAQLRKIDRFSHLEQIKSIKVGASGACVFAASGGGEEVLVKHTLRREAPATAMQSEREYHFLGAARGSGIPAPEVLYRALDEERILLVERMYAPILQQDWDERLLIEAMRVLARIHASEWAAYKDLHRSDESAADDAALEAAYTLWQSLAGKHPGIVDGEAIRRICGDYHRIAETIEALALPACVCHGDSHPENFLMGEQGIVLCDWQGVHIGAGAGDVSFFISRGVDMGIDMDIDKLMEGYLREYNALCGANVGLRALRKHSAAATLQTSFLHWAGYLQSSDALRVARIYEMMVESYGALFLTE